jgi:hypothetical protein
MIDGDSDLRNCAQKNIYGLNLGNRTVAKDDDANVVRMLDEFLCDIENVDTRDRTTDVAQNDDPKNVEFYETPANVGSSNEKSQKRKRIVREERDVDNEPLRFKKFKNGNRVAPDSDFYDVFVESSIHTAFVIGKLYDTFKTELKHVDIKTILFNLKSEIVSMDLETGMINTNKLSGDERFEAMLFSLDLYEWTRSDSQVEMHDYAIIVLLPLIYGDEWTTNHEHIMVKHNVLRYYPEIIIICARRWGKTTGMAMIMSSSQLFIPSIRTLVFSTGQRVSNLFMDEIIARMKESPFMASCEIVTSNSETLVISHFGNIRSLLAMPSNLHVRFNLFIFHVCFCFVFDAASLCDHGSNVRYIQNVPALY